MDYVINLINEELKKELIALATAKALTQGEGFIMERATMNAFQEQKRLAEERIPQLRAAVKKLLFKTEE